MGGFLNGPTQKTGGFFLGTYLGVRTLIETVTTLPLANVKLHKSVNQSTLEVSSAVIISATTPAAPAV